MLIVTQGLWKPRESDKSTGVNSLLLWKKSQEFLLAINIHKFKRCLWMTNPAIVSFYATSKNNSALHYFPYEWPKFFISDDFWLISQTWKLPKKNPLLMILFRSCLIRQDQILAKWIITNIILVIWLPC